MITVNELTKWLIGMPGSHQIAIDEGGLTLLVLDKNETLTEDYLEIGGISDDSPAWDGELTEGEIAQMDRLRNA